ncbi:MAG: NUDIX hydrolase [Salinivirgaceae bacterium]|nr:NUDIX hydrolase [Salinivirgaceae bacterium]
MNFSYKYARPMVTTDIILFSGAKGRTELLLIKRLNSPYKDHWAFPGGFVDENESLEAAARRELLEETGIKEAKLIQFQAFGDFGRDPRGHCVSVVYYQFVDKNNLTLKAGDDAKEADWFSINNLPKLAFDHSKILKEAINKLL